MEYELLTNSVSEKLYRNESHSSSSSLDNIFKGTVDDLKWYNLVDAIDLTWHDTILPLFQHYTERTPGSFIEKKEINVTWHYRNADPEFGNWQATELSVNLENILAHLPVSVQSFLIIDYSR